MSHQSQISGETLLVVIPTPLLILDERLSVLSGEPGVLPGFFNYPAPN